MNKFVVLSFLVCLSCTGAFFTQDEYEKIAASPAVPKPCSIGVQSVITYCLNMMFCPKLFDVPPACCDAIGQIFNECNSTATLVGFNTGGSFDRCGLGQYAVPQAWIAHFCPDLAVPTFSPSKSPKPSKTSSKTPSRGSLPSSSPSAPAQPSVEASVSPVQPSVEPSVSPVVEPEVSPAAEESSPVAEESSPVAEESSPVAEEEETSVVEEEETSAVEEESNAEEENNAEEEGDNSEEVAVAKIQVNQNTNSNFMMVSGIAIIGVVGAAIMTIYHRRRSATFAELREVV